ncbi:MAG: LysM peptidoglycan-binding domain-containing protein, partial [Planctomycetota bacterium]
MKKVLIAFILLGAGLGIGYTQGAFDSFLGTSKEAEGKTPDPIPTDNQDPAQLLKSDNPSLAASLLEVQTSGADYDENDLLLLGACYKKMNNGAAEKETWQRVLREFSNSPACGEALWNLASLAKRENLPEEALAYTREAYAKYPATPGGARAAKELGAIYLEGGDKANARRAYSTALGIPDPKEREKIKKILLELNGELTLSGFSGESGEVYTVKPGDSLARIARRFRTTIGLIQIVNRLDGTIIHPGQQLKIVKGEVRLELVKSTFTLAVFIDNVWVKEYLVGIGKNDKTPEGEFEIANRIIDPPWFWKGEVIP